MIPPLAHIELFFFGVGPVFDKTFGTAYIPSGCHAPSKGNNGHGGDNDDDDDDFVYDDD